MLEFWFWHSKCHFWYPPKRRFWLFWGYQKWHTIVHCGPFLLTTASDPLNSMINHAIQWVKDKYGPFSTCCTTLIKFKPFFYYFHFSLIQHDAPSQRVWRPQKSKKSQKVKIRQMIRLDEYNEKMYALKCFIREKMRKITFFLISRIQKCVLKWFDWPEILAPSLKLADLAVAHHHKEYKKNLTYLYKWFTCSRYVTG